ncbi:hypothetical protein ACJRO7_012314 [Eucalyptus globulus]|uniref:Uncharacterized protein n=1 Tax=Eucalyptus globulus TaxID=34317 RepID=A0ABD3LI98_EUCGL
MADFRQPAAAAAAAASSQAGIAGPSLVAHAETEKDMPPALSDGNEVPLPLSNHEVIPSPLSDSDAIHSLNLITPSQHQVLRFRHARLHINPPPETLLHHHTIDIELIQMTDDDKARRKRLPPVNLGKVFLGLTYQAMVAFMVFQVDIDNLHHSMILSFLLSFSEVAVVVGFTACVVGVLMRELAYTEMAMVAERAGSASAALGFFLMMSMFLSKLCIGIGWVCAVVSFLAFVLLFLKMRKAG